MGRLGVSGAARLCNPLEATAQSLLVTLEEAVATVAVGEATVATLASLPTLTALVYRATAGTRCLHQDTTNSSTARGICHLSSTFQVIAV